MLFRKDIRFQSSVFKLDYKLIRPAFTNVTEYMTQDILYAQNPVSFAKGHTTTTNKKIVPLKYRARNFNTWILKSVCTTKIFEIVAGDASVIEMISFY